MNRRIELSAVVVGLALAFQAPAFAKAPKTPAPAPQPKEVKTPSHYLAEGWNHYYYVPFLNQLGDIPTIPSASAEEQARCDRFYSKVRSTGQMKIVMGIGYYDFSEGEPFGFDYREDGSFAIKHHDFGMNATIDITYDIMYREILTRRCSGSLQLCGFTEVARGVYSKTVTDPRGQKIQATVEIKDSSVTPEHSQNIGVLAAQQQAKSDATTQWFFDSVKSADLVIYNGHSRKGGGPDFHPPKLLQNLHVNYSWYGKNTPGLKRLLTALSSAPTKPAALLMMSCNSANLFEKPIRKAAPQMSVAGTNAVIPGNIPNKGAIAGMDAFLKFQCQEGFNKQMRLDPDMNEQIKAPVIY
ncbi:MAG TPA: hypothetical protein VM432_06845 [Bdellovibrionales bacterium]|nr:hypothetical protein [Bdellovibrionales bacterium]